MTKFQKQFLLKCLTHLDAILSDPDKLKGTTAIFEKAKSDKRVSDIADKISDSQNWSTNDKDSLTAAILLSTINATTELRNHSDYNEGIEAATTVYLDKVPVFTEGTSSDNRLASVRTNIGKLKKELTQEPKPESKEAEPKKEAEPRSVSKKIPANSNPHSFFTTAGGIGALALVAAAAIVLSR
jgi:hypothetical protein